MKPDTIITGNCKDYARELPDECADLVLTDPPFGIGFKYKHDYKDDPELYIELLKWTIAESNRVIKPGGLCFVFVAQKRLREVFGLFPEGVRIFAACKNFVQMRPTAVQYSYDPVLFWQKDGERLIDARAGRRDWHIGNTADTRSKKYKAKSFHSCPRPLDTISYMVENFCPAGGLVVDWFMGSATTAVACKTLGRHWWGCEIDAGIAEQARQRVRRVSPMFFELLEEPKRTMEQLGF